MNDQLKLNRFEATICYYHKDCLRGIKKALDMELNYLKFTTFELNILEIKKIIVFTI